MKTIRQIHESMDRYARRKVRGFKIGRLITEADASKIRSLAKTHPDAAEAVAAFIQSYMSRPMAPVKQHISTACSQTGISRNILLKFLRELGLDDGFRDDD